MLKFFSSSSISGLHYFSCQCHLFRKEVIMYTPNVSAHASVTLKKTQTIKRKKYSKTNNERVHWDCSFWISSIALLSWISEIRKKKKKKKPQKLTLTHQIEHRRVLFRQTYVFSFASAKPTRSKDLFFDMLRWLLL